MKKLCTIARAIAMLLFTAAWLVASTASLLHDAIHHGGAHGSASHHHGQEVWDTATTVPQVDAADAITPVSTVAGCFFCVHGSLVLLLAMVATLPFLSFFFQRRFSGCASAIAFHRFLLPSLRAPPQFG
ncbi:MAG: hypothetical protein IPM61_05835 [Chlorobi bacterium]|nr:hypothetical protein [Chlorobiota bacterium]MBX7216097.1 hypothetical protein [Candidatus Kapabacteria bacterium]